MAPALSDKLPIIYLADDSADYRFMVKYVFTRYLPQFALSLFSGGEPLLNQLRRKSEQPALIFLDLYMPGLSGQQALEQLKQQSAWKSIPVVMVTSSTSSEEIQVCYEAGANSCLAKPMGLDSIRQLYEQVCSYWIDTGSTPVQH